MSYFFNQYYCWYVYIFVQKFDVMKKQLRLFLLPILLICLIAVTATAQCSICTKTAQQLGEGPAKSLNTGILYLMFTPLAIMAFIGFRWWKKEKEVMASENNIA